RSPQRRKPWKGFPPAPPGGTGERHREIPSLCSQCLCGEYHLVLQLKFENFLRIHSTAIRPTKRKSIGAFQSSVSWRVVNVAFWDFRFAERECRSSSR